MEDDKKQEDIIYILRSNHFVQEYFEQNSVNIEIRRNPRFQSIIWHVSVMLKQQKINFAKKEAVEWIHDNIQIGEQGEIMYMLSEKDGYFPLGSTRAIQFIKYFCDEEGLKRGVKEINEKGHETLHIISNYNQDGIEEKQTIYDKKSGYINVYERIKNRPELRRLVEYDQNKKMINSIEYEKRIFWVALEDLNPNLIEVDPIGINPLLRFGGTPFYEEFSNEDKKQVENTRNRILPLTEKNREEQLQYYKRLNKHYCRTTAFEIGIAKMLSVKNKELLNI